VITVGVDLAAEPKTTAVAVLDWAAGPTVTALRCPADDAAIVTRTGNAAKIGLDCPLGWPEPFVEFVLAHRAGQETASADSVAARRPLAYRATDVYCQQQGLRPLSVSADRIAHAAFRAVALLPKLGAGVDRSGAGLVVETYPAGSLRRWGMLSRGYKRTAGQPLLVETAERLADTIGLRFSESADRELFATSDHAFDAVVAALTARLATIKGAVDPIPPDCAGRARVEGWIALPTTESLDLLRR
jgi:predicted nuclease with RNAse H fold